MIKVKFNDAMKKFLKENYGIKSDYEKKFEKKLNNILGRKVKICYRYKLKSGKIKSGKKIWYTKDFRYKNNLMWKRKVAYIKNKDLMAYELCGNTFYFANRNGIKNCIKKTMKAYVQLLQQMERRENSFTTFLWIDEIDYFVTDFKWTTEIRFYENREKSKNAEIMGKNINDIEVPIMLIYA